MNDSLMQARLWSLQRLTAGVLAACVLIHLGIIIYAVRGGLTAAAILGRTHGNWTLGALYGVFVVACAVHVPLGLINIAAEWWGWRPGRTFLAAAAFGLLLLVMGLRAVYGVLA
jgi:fumarate reductase subunit C